MLSADALRLIERIILVLLVLAVAFGCGWMAQGWRKDRQIAALAASQAGSRAIAAEAAEAQLVDAAAKVHAAADAANVNVADLGRRLDQMALAFRAAKPLPVDCRPDDFRVRHLSDTVDAARAAIAKGTP